MLNDTASILLERITIVANLVELTVKIHFRNQAHIASTRDWRLRNKCCSVLPSAYTDVSFANRFVESSGDGMSFI